MDAVPSCGHESPHPPVEQDSPEAVTVLGWETRRFLPGGVTWPFLRTHPVRAVLPLGRGLGAVP
jgi:hypothetical protein